MRNLTPAHIRLVKLTLFLVFLLPLIRVIFRGVEGNLGANPLEFITRATGDWTIYCLCLTLCISPLRRFTGWHWIQRLRRLFGLYVFFYAVLHFVCFLWFDHFFDVEAMLQDILKRPFIALGFCAFVLLLPLAATSTDQMMRRLGRWWGKLHQLVYAVALLAVLHFWWMRSGKNNLLEPVIIAGVMLMLLGMRLVFYWRARRAAVVAQ
ncbi:MAG: sulfoxide reductase heme-binding subunit YedZ [Oxalobacteraceae bacterium]|jgi:sulfoxide reductase heme-binding subunit YedZ|nr:sulfoxide reductase heme-binding subunit YedZ [Oxalobacteraceae bacterium]